MEDQRLVQSWSLFLEIRLLEPNFGLPETVSPLIWGLDKDTESPS